MNTLFAQVIFWGASLVVLYGLIVAVSIMFAILKRGDEFYSVSIREPYLIADEGELKEIGRKSLISRFRAPAVVVVKPYNAVVLELGSQVSRIEGPGILRLQKGEEIKAVVDLRPQGGGFEREALTQDNVPLKIKGGVSFRIEPSKEARDRGDAGDLETKDFTGIISGPYPVYQRTIYRAVYGVPAGKDWQSQTKGTAGGRVGRAIQSFRIDEIFVVDEDKRVNLERTALQEILDQARTGAIEAARSWGVSVAGMGISSIEMPEVAQEEFLRRWIVPWRGWQILRQTEIERQAASIEAVSKHTVATAKQRSTDRTTEDLELVPVDMSEPINKILQRLLESGEESIEIDRATLEQILTYSMAWQESPEDVE